MTKRSCVEIAGYRARHARERVRTSVAPLSPLRGEVAFGVAWLSALASSLVMTPFRARPSPRSEPTYQATPQELGVPGPLRPRPQDGHLLHGRYRVAPSMSRLMRDLRRPAAYNAARAALLARIGSDPDTLSWAAGLVDSGGAWRLALHARSGASDADVVSAWRAEARVDKAAAEGEAAAALRAKLVAANAAEGDDDNDNDKIRPLLSGP